MANLKLEIPLSAISGISPAFLKRLEKLGIKTIKDLIWHFPQRYEDFSQIYKIADLSPGQQATVRGIVREINARRSWRRRMIIVEAIIEDESGPIKAIWFNQPYVASILKTGRLANFAGKISLGEEGIYLNNPAYELLNSKKRPDEQETKHTGRLVPIYPETKGLTSKGLRFLVKPILRNLEELPEWIPEKILESAALPEINEALGSIHFPKEIDDAILAKKRFAFEDLFLLQLFNLKQKMKMASEQAPTLAIDIEKLKKIIGELPFELTFSQKKSLWEIIKNIGTAAPMNRLLQGDVGSGKTVVAAIAAIVAAENGFQTAFMAPTEILAEQHFATLKNIFGGIGAAEQPVMALLTSGNARIIYENDLETGTKKSDLLEKIASGEIKIVIGTHTLIQNTVSFRNLGLVIVDEQHRFGVKQRSQLLRASQIDADTTQNNADDNEFLYKNLSYKTRGAIFTVCRAIGLGLKESVYQKALEKELSNQKIPFEKEKSIGLKYDGEIVGVFRPDFVIDEKIILELKALPFLGKIEEKQLWTYLKGSNYKVALLVNFGGKELEIKRVVFDIARSHPRGSISHLRSSAYDLRKSALVPHFLSMSATPIPRTLMLTVFGDLDISTITELPSGRKQIVTRFVAPNGRDEAYAFIRGEVKNGRQVFVICPRIEPAQTNAEHARSDAGFPRGSTPVPRNSALLWEMRSVKAEYEKLSKKIFPDLKVKMLHGRMKAREKGKIMSDMRGGKTDILVSTSVIEVGVDVPNATIMMIEGADRFGLAQLYQFRGRVGRGSDQSYCFLFTDSESGTANERLSAIVEAKNGFELAEKDLRLRGPGEFLGESQTGLPDIAMRALQNTELVKTSREAALAALRNDPSLARHAALKKKLKEFEDRLHRE